VIEGLEPYPEYGRSDVPWAPDLPGTWNTERAKWLFTRMNRPTRPEDEVVTCFRDGMVTLRKNRRLRGFTEATVEHGYQGIRKGDLVIHQMDAFAGAIGVSDSDGKGTPVYSVCQPKSGINARYYSYAIRQMSHSGWILALAKGIRERSTDFRYEMFGNQRVPLPASEEQSAIVRFMDNANHKISGFVLAKRRLIGLLNEQKMTIIHRAVTRGVDPGVLMKPSEIPWLGDIPSHWEVRRAKQLCTRIVDCKNRTPELIPDGCFIVVRTTNIRNGSFSLVGSYPTDQRHFTIWTARGAPRPGDVFFTREAPVGEACLVPDLNNLCMGQRMMYFRPNASLLDSEFLLHSIYGPLVRTYIEHVSNGSTVGHLRLGQVTAMPLLWCPLEEQRAIVEYIEKESAPLRAAISRTQREIALMQEYRATLAADVVTGKLDVRGVASELPDVEGEAFRGSDIEGLAIQDLSAGDTEIIDE
jgi:type I restriction enzyme S subunit